MNWSIRAPWAIFQRNVAGSTRKRPARSGTGAHSPGAGEPLAKVPSWGVLIPLGIPFVDFERDQLILGHHVARNLRLEQHKFTISRDPHFIGRVLIGLI